ncbi:ABC transporter permease [Thermomonospora umbrina]|uniref:Peptide/nickel transport system permease protein n=1 Tax=Thermomonospora umbrina TaxID=111806 RepID=A0A3D9SK81_9ACTN|nr:ABC transporter permease [Thermomonospora umbrina]REE94800.1 peptide/nickel transport system permease protein [Thermomonospora umbrina]
MKRRPSARVVRAVLVRLGASVLVLWGAVTASFAALQAVPGEVVDSIVGTNDVTPEVRAQIIAEYGLDRPVLAQYGTFLNRILHGDLGRSYRLDQTVGEAIGSQLAASLRLTTAGIALALLVATVLALLTARRGRRVRALSSGIELVGVSVPGFWAGILLLTVFSFQLGWFPATGGSGPSGLVLPACAIAIPVGALLTQVMREGLERALEQPFVLTARSRGMSDGGVRLRHALRHALLPVVTLAGWLFGALLGGMVVTEQIFSREGIGRLVVGAVESKDLPVVMGVVLVTATLYVLVNIALDLLYLVIDPRLRGAR